MLPRLQREHAFPRARSAPRETEQPVPRGGPRVSKRSPAARRHFWTLLAWSLDVFSRLAVGALLSGFGPARRYWSLAYSAFACFRMGISASASFQRAKKS